MTIYVYDTRTQTESVISKSEFTSKFPRATTLSFLLGVEEYFQDNLAIYSFKSFRVAPKYCEGLKTYTPSKIPFCCVRDEAWFKVLEFVGNLRVIVDQNEDIATWPLYADFEYNVSGLKLRENSAADKVNILSLYESLISYKSAYTLDYVYSTLKRLYSTPRVDWLNSSIKLPFGRTLQIEHKVGLNADGSVNSKYYYLIPELSIKRFDAFDIEGFGLIVTTVRSENGEIENAMLYAVPLYTEEAIPPKQDKLSQRLLDVHFYLLNDHFLRLAVQNATHETHKDSFLPKKLFRGSFFSKDSYITSFYNYINQDQHSLQVQQDIICSLAYQTSNMITSDALERLHNLCKHEPDITYKNIKELDIFEVELQKQKTQVLMKHTAFFPTTASLLKLPF